MADVPSWMREVAYELCLKEMSDPEKPWPVRIFVDGGHVDTTQPYWHNFLERIEQTADAMRRHGWREPA